MLNDIETSIFGGDHGNVQCASAQVERDPLLIRAVVLHAVPDCSSDRLLQQRSFFNSCQTRSASSSLALQCSEGCGNSNYCCCDIRPSLTPHILSKRFQNLRGKFFGRKYTPRSDELFSIFLP